MPLVRSISVLALGGAALLLACQSAPPPVERQRWSRLESPHFEMWTAASPSASRALVEDLERFRSVLPKLASLEAPDSVMRIVAFGDPVGFAEFAHRTESASFALSTLDGPVLVLDASSEDPRTDLRHAYVHANLRLGGEPAIPPWYEEGLALYLAQVELADDGLVLGVLSPRLGNWLRLADPLPLRRVLEARESRIAWSEGEINRFGAQAWALVHLLRHPRLAEDEVQPALFETVRAALGEGDAEDAASPAYEEAIQADYAAYLRSESFPTYRTNAAVAPAPPARPTSAPPGDALEILALLARDLGRNDAFVARLHASARQADPERARGSLAAAPRGADPSAAEATLRRWEAAEPGHPDDWIRLGDAWRALAARDPELAEGRAQAAYRRAITLDPDHPGAARKLAATLGSSWEEHAAAAALLARAAASRPGVPGLELELAARLTRAGQGGRASLVLARLARAPHSAVTIDAALVEAAMQRAGSSLAELESRLWEAQLLLRTPEPDAHLDQMAPWVEVAGSAGLGESPLHDVVVALDISEPSQLPSGLDVNGNGRVGRWIDPALTGAGARPMITDRGDTILAAMRWVGAKLVRQLDPGSTRVAVLGYGKRAYQIAPFGPPEAAEEALETFQSGVRLSGEASISAGLLGSLALLQEADTTERPRRSTILLLAGTEPLHPNRRRARTRATETAQAIGQLGVRVHTYAVGLHAPDEVGPLLATVSEASGGVHVPVLDVTRAALPDMGVRLAGLEAVAIRNLTTGDDARAQRVFPDGSFDAMVPLTPGENWIEVVARPDGRAPLRETRRVVYTVPEEPTERHRRRAAVLLWELRNRSIEVATRLDIANAQAARAGESSGVPQAPPFQRTEIRIGVAAEAKADGSGDRSDGRALPALPNGGDQDPETSVSSEPPESEN